MANNDPGADDFEWPEVSQLRPAEAVKLLDHIENLAAEANARADTLKKRKAQAKQIMLAVLEEYELPDASGITSSGGKVRYTPYDFDVFTVDNPEAFKAWAETQNENYFDPTPKLREGIFLAEMRRRHKDREPLPPGVRRWTDTRLSRTATK